MTSMWRRTKQSAGSADAAAPSESGATSPKSSSSHRLAKTLLRPFTRKPRQEDGPLRSKSASHLVVQDPERALRLSKSSLDEGEGKTAAETRVVGENMERAPRVVVREVRRLTSAPPDEIEEVGSVPVQFLEEVSAPKALAEGGASREAANGASTPGAALPPEAEGLPEEEVRDLIAAFKYFDHNSDGCIDKEELGAVLRSLGDNPSDADLTAMITAVDQNGDGSICLGEFLNLNKMALEAGLAGESDRELQATFDVFDLDKNGFISCEELQQVLSKLSGEPVVKAECFRMIQGVDQDGDGQVNFEEFHTMMQQALPC